ncbi:methyltransferase domain-containing protein [Ditylenchus destructor]|uniref:Methyltransferase domain-containing protein n=1 Tax=Ditylenchus destructor TaxID=166010 RepID=A0AAD4MKF4_9BILA|nr:methyltransferase domain-containing protein [Ditylenchus destructor]
MLVPEVFCPNKARLGTVQDGGKWVCSPNLLKSDGKECAIYALGLNDEISFEVAIQEFTESRCVLRGIDVRDNSLETIETLNQNNGVFLKAFVGTKESMENNPFVEQSLQNNPKGTVLEALTLQQIMKHFGDTSIEILKMDIEGGEVDIADEIFSLSPCQVLMEVHLLNAYKIYKFLQRFSRHGYFLFETEANPLRLDMREYNFIHANCLAKYGVDIVLGKYLS